MQTKLLVWLKRFASLSIVILIAVGCDSRTGGKKKDTVDPDPIIVPLPVYPDRNLLDDEGEDYNVQDGNSGPIDADPVPEPSTFILVGSGIVLFSMFRKRKK